MVKQNHFFVLINTPHPLISHLRKLILFIDIYILYIYIVFYTALQFFVTKNERHAFLINLHILFTI